MELTDLQNAIAIRIDKAIKEQEQFIKEQSIVVQNSILGEYANGFNLRQNLLCLNTAERALELLQKTFLDNLGISHSEWYAQTHLV